MTDIKLNSTLCYIEKDGCYLMLYRNKKPNDPCEGKWVGVGGKFEEGETPEECLIREVREETGLILTEYEFRGIINFVSDRFPDEDMYLYTATGYQGDDTFPQLMPSHDMENGSGKIKKDDNPGNILYNNKIAQTSYECNEGDLCWIPVNMILNLNLWEGDKYFLEPMIAGQKEIYMLCRYEGHKCVEVRNI